MKIEVRRNSYELINTTNSHAALVRANLPALTPCRGLFRGQYCGCFDKAPTHYELLISNKHRAIRETKVELIREFFLKPMN